jgi:hypothetical protein
MGGALLLGLLAAALLALIRLLPRREALGALLERVDLLERDRSHIFERLAGTELMAGTAKTQVDGVEPRLELAERATLPSWLPTAIREARKNGFDVSLDARGLRFYRKEPSPEREGFVRLPLGAGPPEKKVRDSLYGLIEYEPYKFAGSLFRFSKPLGED